jgi:hypothetical protein
MSFQAYLDAVKAKTGRSPADFAKLAAQKDLTKHGEIGWFKSDYELDHGHATAIAGVKSGSPPKSEGKKMDDLFGLERFSYTLFILWLDPGFFSRLCRSC